MFEKTDTVFILMFANAALLTMFIIGKIFEANAPTEAEQFEERPTFSI